MELNISNTMELNISKINLLIDTNNENTLIDYVKNKKNK